MDLILKKVLRKAVPSKAEKEKVNSIINLSKSILEKQLRKQKVKAEVFVGGSIAKGTWLKGQYDIDLFVRFDGYKDEEIGKILTKVVKKSFRNCVVLHGSRDYCKVNFRGFEIEFIPVLKIKSPNDAKNSMDASLFHVDYVKKKILSNPRLADEIRLFKLFAKAQGVYGAETHISGISGYVSELLVIHFGSFKKLVKNSDKLIPPIYIDIEKHYKNISEIKHSLGKSKLKSPIILIDPVLKTRNAAASLSYKVFSSMLLSLRLFNRKPSPSFFAIKSKSIEDLKEKSRKRGTLFVYKSFKVDFPKEDVFLAKLNKILKRIKSSIEKEGIKVFDYGYLVNKNKIYVYFELETLKLSKVKKHYGPPVWVDSKYFNSFIDKWKKVYVEGTNLVCDIPRKETNVKKIVKKLLEKGLKDV